jgi:RNA polymerase sigma-70 factor (ECF subfamily)
MAAMASSDLLLARRVLRGDGAAFDEFFRGHFPGLMRFAQSRLGGDGEAAEEVVQATLCAAVAKLGTYRGEAALFTWLCTFCRHEIGNWLRRRGRDGERVELVEDRPEIAAALESLSTSLEGDPERSLGRAETARLVHVTLDRLPGSYASALEWKYVEGISVAEIAARLSLTTKAAESLLTRAREAFRDGFKEINRGALPKPLAGERRG